MLGKNLNCNIATLQHCKEVHGKAKLVKGQKMLTFSATQGGPSKKKVKAIIKKI